MHVKIPDNSPPPASIPAPSMLLWIALTGALLLSACGGGGTDVDDPGEPESADAGAVENSALDSAPPPMALVEGYGYRPRACGFDLDDDGVVGESEDDCRVCDGATLDPDGDGVEEDLFYIDCDGGQDDRQCGTPDRPCGTIAYAWSQRADGAGDGAEDILCFRGTCREEGIRPGVAGAAGTVERPATGSEARPFELPRDPTLLAGWDTDGDGEYPPLDTDDTAVLEGRGLGRAVVLGPRNDRLEMAHFTAAGFGAESEARDSAFLGIAPGQGELTHVHVHNLHLLDINRARPTHPGLATVSLVGGKTRPRWWLVENLWAPRNGGWFVHGAAEEPGPDEGPYRFQGITYTAQACDFARCGNGASVMGFYLWGHVSGIEVLDSHFDANVAEWEPKPGGGPSGALFALTGQCSQDWTLRGNLLVDYKNALWVQGHAERYCDGGSARPVDRVVFDRNEVRNAYEPWAAGDVAVLVTEGGDQPGETVGDLTVSSNLLASPVGLEACFWIRGGNGAETPPGTIELVGNTCIANIDYHGALAVGELGGGNAAFPHQRLRVTGNVFSGLLGHEDLNVRFTYGPEGLEMDGNRYDPSGGFSWLGGEPTDLGGWRGATGVDAESTACLPAFVDFENGDYRPAEGDVCMDGAGRRAAAPSP
ncbi:MAG: hypothetical protein AAGD06_04535 [Acidobacteriota bacterium]